MKEDEDDNRQLLGHVHHFIMPTLNISLQSQIDVYLILCIEVIFQMLCSIRKYFHLCLLMQFTTKVGQIQKSAVDTLT